MSYSVLSFVRLAAAEYEAVSGAGPAGVARHRLGLPVDAPVGERLQAQWMVLLPGGGGAMSGGASVTIEP